MRVGQDSWRGLGFRFHTIVSSTDVLRRYQERRRLRGKDLGTGSQSATTASVAGDDATHNPTTSLEKRHVSADTAGQTSNKRSRTEDVEQEARSSQPALIPGSDTQQNHKRSRTVGEPQNVRNNEISEVEPHPLQDVPTARTVNSEVVGQDKLVHKVRQLPSRGPPTPEATPAPTSPLAKPPLLPPGQNLDLPPAIQVSAATPATQARLAPPRLIIEISDDDDDNIGDAIPSKAGPGTSSDIQRASLEIDTKIQPAQLPPTTTTLQVMTERSLTPQPPVMQFVSAAEGTGQAVQVTIPSLQADPSIQAASPVRKASASPAKSPKATAATASKTSKESPRVGRKRKASAPAGSPSVPSPTAYTQILTSKYKDMQQKWNDNIIGSPPQLRAATDSPKRIMSMLPPVSILPQAGVQSNAQTPGPAPTEASTSNAITAATPAAPAVDTPKVARDTIANAVPTTVVPAFAPSQPVIPTAPALGTAPALIKPFIPALPRQLPEQSATLNAAPTVPTSASSPAVAAVGKDKPPSAAKTGLLGKALERYMGNNTTNDSGTAIQTLSKASSPQDDDATTIAIPTSITKNVTMVPTDEWDKVVDQLEYRIEHAVMQKVPVDARNAQLKESEKERKRCDGLRKESRSFAAQRNSRRLHRNKSAKQMVHAEGPAPLPDTTGQIAKPACIDNVQRNEVSHASASGNDSGFGASQAVLQDTTVSQRADEASTLLQHLVTENRTVTNGPEQPLTMLSAEKSGSLDPNRIQVGQTTALIPVFKAGNPAQSPFAAHNGGLATKSSTSGKSHGNADMVGGSTESQPRQALAPTSMPSASNTLSQPSAASDSQRTTGVSEVGPEPTSEMSSHRNNSHMRASSHVEAVATPAASVCAKEANGQPGSTFSGIAMHKSNIATIAAVNAPNSITWTVPYKPTTAQAQVPDLPHGNALKDTNSDARPVPSGTRSHSALATTASGPTLANELPHVPITRAVPARQTLDSPQSNFDSNSHAQQSQTLQKNSRAPVQNQGNLIQSVVANNQMPAASAVTTSPSSGGPLSQLLVNRANYAVAAGNQPIASNPYAARREILLAVAKVAGEKCDDAYINQAEMNLRAQGINETEVELSRYIAWRYMLVSYLQFMLGSPVSPILTLLQCLHHAQNERLIQQQQQAFAEFHTKPLFCPAMPEAPSMGLEQRRKIFMDRLANMQRAALQKRQQLSHDIGILSYHMTKLDEGLQQHSQQQQASAQTFMTQKNHAIDGHGTGHSIPPFNYAAYAPTQQLQQTRGVPDLHAQNYGNVSHPQMPIQHNQGTLVPFMQSSVQQSEPMVSSLATGTGILTVPAVSSAPLSYATQDPNADQNGQRQTAQQPASVLPDAQYTPWNPAQMLFQKQQAQRLRDIQQVQHGQGQQQVQQMQEMHAPSNPQAPQISQALLPQTTPHNIDPQILHAQQQQSNIESSQARHQQALLFQQTRQAQQQDLARQSQGLQMQHAQQSTQAMQTVQQVAQPIESRQAVQGQPLSHLNINFIAGGQPRSSADPSRKPHHIAHSTPKL